MSLRSKVKATASAKANWRRPSGETKNDRSEGKPEWCGLRLGCSQALPRNARHAPPCPTSRPALCCRTVQKGSLHRHRRIGSATGLSSPPHAATRRAPTGARPIPRLLPACRRGAAREPDAGWISGLPAHQNAITHSQLLSVPRKPLTGARSKNDVSSRSATPCLVLFPSSLLPGPCLTFNSATRWRTRYESSLVLLLRLVDNYSALAGHYH